MKAKEMDRDIINIEYLETLKWNFFTKDDFCHGSSEMLNGIITIITIADTRYRIDIIEWIDDITLNVFPLNDPGNILFLSYLRSKDSDIKSFYYKKVEELDKKITDEKMTYHKSLFDKILLREKL